MHKLQRTFDTVLIKTPKKLKENLELASDKALTKFSK